MIWYFRKFLISAAIVTDPNSTSDPIYHHYYYYLLTLWGRKLWVLVPLDWCNAIWLWAATCPLGTRFSILSIQTRRSVCVLGMKHYITWGLVHKERFFIYLPFLITVSVRGFSDYPRCDWSLSKVMHVSVRSWPQRTEVRWLSTFSYFSYDYKKTLFGNDLVV